MDRCIDCISSCRLLAASERLLTVHCYLSVVYLAGFAARVDHTLSVLELQLTSALLASGQ